MTEMARKRRWSRFVDRQSGKALIVPIDHGLTMGPLDGLNRVEEVALAGPGSGDRHSRPQGFCPAARRRARLRPDDSPERLAQYRRHPDLKQMVTSVEAAVRLGADAVSIQTTSAPTPPATTCN